MNRKMPVAIALGVIITMAAISFSAYSGTAVSEGLKVTGWVKVEVVRDGTIIYTHDGHNLITNAGKDFIAHRIGSTDTVGANGANYIALTTTAITPAATDTTLSGEITTNGLARAQGTYSHTNGTNTYTITKQFTASGTFTGVQGAGLFTASSSGTMMSENTFSSVNLISGDQITITWTITIS
ncbi:MAG: hypothetical protein M1503_10320 [Thaumarchaeota archaeon]|nr:hypothetical protein [Nitrososphaerota archaeon]MCL5318635.1 hypothetical protein [Nitrososphaerota archaeon]